MMIVDVHAHMDMPQFLEKDRIIEVLEECKKINVVAIVSNGTDIESNRRVLALAERYNLIKPALGIYPTTCLEMAGSGEGAKFSEELDFIEGMIKKKKCIAIGEVGLEYKAVEDLDDNKKTIMRECLKGFIDIAKRHDIPIILHTRGAELEAVELLEGKGMKHRKVVMHCFSARKYVVQRVIDNGWHLSIPCNIVRSEHFQNIVKITPMHQLLTETDSPLLPPYNEAVNTPANIVHTIDKIAQIKGLTKEETANIIYSNYQRIFL